MDILTRLLRSAVPMSVNANVSFVRVDPDTLNRFQIH
jgi:hypothetical protein